MNFSDYGIRVDEAKEKEGEQRTLCPKCSGSRKKSSEKCLSVNTTEKVWFCHHCGWKGTLLDSNGSGNHTNTSYIYRDEQGQILYRKVRSPQKKFWFDRPDGAEGWVSGITGIRRVLYRLDELIQSAGTIYIVEGEKDVDTLTKHGLITTCNDSGAGKWNLEFNECLRGRDVVILEDNDEPGRKHGKIVSEGLHGIASQIKIIRFKELPEGGDVSDYLAAHNKNDLMNLQACTPVFEGSYQEYFLDGNLTNDGAKENDWPDPEPIETKLLAVPTLPFEILPDSFLPWIKDVSHRMQSPPDFVAMAALTLTAALIGTRCGIRPKQFDNWLVVPNLWGGMLGAPSTLKTPSMNEALKPLNRLEFEAKEEFDEMEKQYEADLMEYKAEKFVLEAAMKKATSGKGGRSTEGIKEQYRQLEPPEKPTMDRYKTNDATIEKLSELCNENPRGLLISADELVRLFSTWDKPGRESDRAFFLEAWNGDGSHTSDRIGRGTIFTKHLCLSIFGGIQPSKLTAYLHKSMNGLENDGLLQRFQLLVYPDDVKEWKLVDRVPDTEGKNRAYGIIRWLAHTNFCEHGATQGEFDPFAYFHFSDDAQALFNEWITDLEINKLRVNDHPIVLEHFGKYRSLMPSLALIFHLIAVADGLSSGGVSLSAAEKAAALCEYLESHARRIYGLVANIDQQAASVLAEKILAGKLSDGFTARDVYRKNWHLLNTRELARMACNELVEADWLKKHLTPSAFGQREKVAYKINPKIQDENA